MQAGTCGLIYLVVHRQRVLQPGSILLAIASIDQDQIGTRSASSACISPSLIPPEIPTQFPFLLSQL